MNFRRGTSLHVPACGFGFLGAGIQDSLLQEPEHIRLACARRMRCTKAEVIDED